MKTKEKDRGMLTTAAFITLLLVIPVIFFVSAAAAVTTTVEVSDASAGVGGTTTAQITVHDVSDLGGFSITLSYDPAVVNVTGATNNPALPDNFGVSDFSNAPNGSVVLASSGMTLPSLSGDVLLTTVTLEAVGSAGQTSPLNIVSVGLVDSAGNDISASVTAVNGTFTIVETETVPPTIEFIAPTPVNGSTVTVNYVNVTVNVTDESGVSTVLLNWNGDNETMYMTGLNTWSVTKTGLENKMYTYKIYANDTVGNMGVSDTRVVYVEKELPTSYISVQDANATVGGTTTSEIVVHNVTDFGGFGITLSYDPTVVVVTGATNNPALPDNFGVSDFSNAPNGSVVLASSGMTLPSLSGDVVLTTVTLEAVGSAGQTSPLNIVSVGLVDSAGNDISAGVTAVNGTFSIIAGLPKTGDINGDSSVNIADAVYLVKYLYHVPGFDELYADGDINSDSSVNIADAVYLVKYLYHVPGYEELYP